ncbi:hypothetical protein N9164_06015 [Draconibacterium sp.]|nr:hypothetical protein [Draconibacterium sp.]
MKNLFIFLFVVTSTFLFAQEKAPELSWPREIVQNEYTITLYQAQLETLNKNILNGRMAISVKKGEEIIFGALWFSARIATDTEARTAVLEAFDIPEIKFPDVDDESKIENLKKIIKNDLESIELEMSLDRIIADLEDVEQEQLLSDQIKNDPPKIYFRAKATVLVVIDGEPILKESEKKTVEYVVNTPFFIAKHKNNYYLRGGEYWYTSDVVEGENWNRTKSVPKDVSNLAKKMVEEEEDMATQEETPAIPDVITTTEPAELVMSTGPLEYEPIDKTSLLYVKNSENDIIMDIKSQEHFVLINGRWYRSKTLKDEAWTFIEPEELPAEFALIPEDASIASVRVSVPGTPEAKEAMYEQQMPQTAVVDRKTAKTEVKYDGEPKFEKIESTTMQYAVNTESTVIKLNKTYYCVDEGIWFESSKATGPWTVSDKRPEEVEEIPPTSPVYNVKYVYIYDSTPEVVYVGYTPGYYHSYYYGGVVVYGTGWYYRPWYGNYYYPRPVTYGFGVHYNPYTGWGFSAGFSYGWFTMSFHSYHSYWGPCGYRHGYRHGYRGGYHHGYHNGYRAGYARGRYDSRNVYKQRPSGVRPTNRDRASTMPVNKSARPTNRANNVYTDRNGNIYQRDNSGNWNQQNKRPSTRPDSRPSQPATRPSQPAQRPSTQPGTRPTQPSQRPSTQPSTRPSPPSNQLQRDYQNRNRGNNNYQNYQRNRPTPSRAPTPRPSGGRRR